MNTPQTCADCSVPLRVTTPCLHGGQWRCWSCHPAGKTQLDLPAGPVYYGRHMGQRYRSRQWFVPRVWRKLKPLSPGRKLKPLSPGRKLKPLSPGRKP